MKPDKANMASQLQVPASDVLTAADGRIIIICVVVTIVAAVVSAAFQIVGFSGAERVASVFDGKDAFQPQYLVFGSILAAAAEELVFRGAVLRALLSRMSRLRAVWVTSVLSGIAHALLMALSMCPFEMSFLAAGFLFLGFVQFTLLGAVMARIVLRNGHLPVVIAIHTLFDALSFAVPVLAFGTFFPVALISEWSVAALVVSSIILVIPLFGLRRRDG